MGAILDRLGVLKRRANDLTPLAPAIVAKLTESNRDALLGGLDRDGQATASLKPGTLAHRAGGGPPRVPLGAASAMVAGFVVVVNVPGPGAISFRGTWPGFAAATYLNAGTSRMAARPAGWLPAAGDWARGQVREYLTKA